MNTTRFKVNEPSIAADLIDGEVVIMNLANGHYYSLLESGADLWTMIVSGWTPIEAAAAITRHYGEDATAVLVDVEKFVHALAAEALVVPATLSVPANDAFEFTATRYESPKLSTFSDIKDLLAIDPVLPDFTPRKPL